VLVVDTGDALVGGGRLGDQTQGQAVVAGMNLMGYDAMALGPNELSLGPEVLQERMGEARFPMLSANVVLSDSGELVAPPYAVLPIGGRSLGIIGLSRSLAEPVRGLQVLEPQAALERYLPEVTAQADWVVVLTNLAYHQGVTLAAAVPGIDLLVAALPRQLPAGAVRAPGTGTIVVTAEQPFPRHSGRRVGTLLLAEGADGGPSPQAWSSISMDASFPDDLVMGLLLDSFQP
jgi:2',3'-cyclic-nucleotide 2'-phosphodiesterase (5'-nucleotidase family)